MTVPVEPEKILLSHQPQEEHQTTITSQVTVEGNQTLNVLYSCICSVRYVKVSCHKPSKSNR